MDKIKIDDIPNRVTKESEDVRKVLAEMDTMKKTEALVVRQIDLTIKLDSFVNKLFRMRKLGKINIGILTRGKDENKIVYLTKK